MSDLISRELLTKEIVNRPTEQSGYNPVYLNGCATRQNEIIDIINDMPTVEAVPKSYAEQIRWERDVAVGQLNEIGCQFGQKMDEVKKKLEVLQWIPCSERLPKVEDLHDVNIVDCTQYLIQRRCGLMDVAHYIRVYGVAYFEANTLRINDVIAWMPLPESYKADMRTSAE